MTAGPPRLHRPGQVADVAALLRTGRAINGGTDLLVERRAGRTDPVLVDLTGLVDALPAVASTATTVTVSALHPLSAIAEGLTGELPALSAAIVEFASTTIRNRATLGGNLATGSPAADTVPALLAADATLAIEGPNGPRTMDLADFLLGPRKVALDPGEWLLDLTMARNAVTGGFRKIGGRRAQSIAMLSLAWQWQSGADGRLHQVRLAMGAVAPTVVRLTAAEAVLEGRIPDEHRIADALDAVAGDISPIDDLRASARYRYRCARGLLREVLELAREPDSREKDQ
ncbi:FAD binding domain-containing protein [Ruania zhangjianzhongii]|uniref:FAD binding domain-containing protein n=1 Tax=Ruania zhangjianzhongii TaxID=2603206 RepID=UPI0011CB9F9E|nr:FAD binding domain-containing protein [Ruania zhangjianzhongii]